MIGDKPNPDDTIDLPPPVVIPQGEALLQTAMAFHKLVGAVAEAEKIAVALARALDAQAARERMT